MEYIDKLGEQLKELTDIPAPSGYEEHMIRFMKEKIESLGVKVEVDLSGNIVARIGKSSGKPKIMFIAHMDEVSLVVKKIEKNGFLRVEIMGGIPVAELPGVIVLVKTRKGDFLNGFFGYKSFHLIPPEQRLTPIPLEDLYVDVGCFSKEEVLNLGIEPGCMVVYGRNFIKRGHVVFAPAIDNRGGCLVLLKLIERLRNKNFNPEIFIVASVLEEYNLRGVIPIARKLNPDFAISIDTAVSTDTPDFNNQLDIGLDKGPVIMTYSFNVRTALSGVIPNPKLLSFVENAAGIAGIKVQKCAIHGWSTDVSWVQRENYGIPSIELGFPTRYLHSTMQACSLKDIEQLILILETLVCSIPEEINLFRI
ncbi:MAG: M20/M25/M40 family metallo-hydrolase [Actinobacteria bacterium]|nr:M20/M25/M40 family metallo-hydrolase [Actinomycetota bacterium]